VLLSKENAQAARLFRSARKHVRARRYIAALADLDRAIRLTPTGVLYDYRGVLLALMERTTEALASFASALSVTALPEKQAEIHFHRGLLHGREGSYDLALMDVARAQQLRPCNLTYREAREKMEKERTRNTSPDACLSS
jgi:tetratricopeptide (TPR) repeat protein